MEWQPIETAPKDGTDVIVFADGKITTAHYEALYVLGTWELCVPSEGYRDSDEVYPTHWMPLPESPNDRAEGPGAASSRTVPSRDVLGSE